MQVYQPLLLFGKKHYTGKKFEKVDDPGKVDVKGLACVRKDICPFLRDSCMSVIRLLLDSRRDAAVETARTAAVALLSHQVPISQLVLSRQMAATYASDSHPQVYVAGLLEQRNPGAGPKPGDRVEFVYVEHGNRNARMFERAEDPDYAAAGSVDVLLYYERQLLTQLGDLFKHVHPGDPFDTSRITALLQELRLARTSRERDFTLAAKRQRPISSWFRPVAAG